MALLRLVFKLLTVSFVTTEVWLHGPARLVAEGQLVSSTTKFHGFAALDLAAGLSKYIMHETKRLEIIKSAKGYEEEVPLVKVRLQKLQLLKQQVTARKAEYELLRQNLSDYHPTTALRLIAHFLDTWESKLKNDTLYGFRFAEFLSNNDDSKLPTRRDLQAAARAVVEIQKIYNLSTSDVYAGVIMGHAGTPLRPQDAYELAVVSSNLHHLKLAAEWYETALNNTSKDEFSTKKVKNASYPIPDALASLGILKYGMDQRNEGLELLERATDLDPDHADILRQFLSHRFGRDVQPLVHSQFGDFQNRWFQLCRNATSAFIAPVKWYHVCRYRRSSRVPYKVYREEVVSRSPYLTIVHRLVTKQEARQLVNVSANKLQNGMDIEGVESHLVFVEGSILTKSVSVAKTLADRISDLTGLDTTERPRHSSGEPLHVFNYGMSGTFLPHYDIYRSYGLKYIMRESGHRMASVLVYLSDVKAGGATAFPYLNFTVLPEIGKALLWYNADPRGEVEKDVLHAGCPVSVGAKWVASKGIWSWGNELRRPCGRKITSSHMAVDKIVSGPPSVLTTGKKSMTMKEKKKMMTEKKKTMTEKKKTMTKNKKT